MELSFTNTTTKPNKKISSSLLNFLIENLHTKESRLSGKVEHQLRCGSRTRAFSAAVRQSWPKANCFQEDRVNKSLMVRSHQASTNEALPCRTVLQSPSSRWTKFQSALKARTKEEWPSDQGPSTKRATPWTAAKPAQLEQQASSSSSKQTASWKRQGSSTKLWFRNHRASNESRKSTLRSQWLQIRFCEIWLKMTNTIQKRMGLPKDGKARRKIWSLISALSNFMMNSAPTLDPLDSKKCVSTKNTQRFSLLSGRRIRWWLTASCLYRESHL